MAAQPKLLDRVSDAVRTRHYSRRTEDAYVHWIRRYIVFHKKVNPSAMGAPEISAFLTWLAVEQRLSASTQNQALCAVLFLYRDVLQMEVGTIAQMPRARMPARLPVVLSREEVRRVATSLGTLSGSDSETGLAARSTWRPSSKGRCSSPYGTHWHSASSRSIRRFTL